MDKDKGLDKDLLKFASGRPVVLCEPLTPLIFLKQLQGHPWNSKEQEEKIAAQIEKLEKEK